MDLIMDPSVGDSYSSPSQRARVVTEDWAAKNLFCIVCPSSSINAEPDNTRVKDFTCPECESTYQLKATGGKFGRTVSNSAYHSKIDAIEAGRVPNYAILQYSSSDWRITDLFVVPGHFFTRSVIQRRNPLRSSARRSGWVGSNILLGEIPSYGRISIVSASMPRPVESIRQEWRRFEFLRYDSRASGGWGADILACVRTLEDENGKPEFTLKEFYRRFSETLSAQHPENRHVEPKIRQQLQVLRDGGILEFLGRGRYRASAAQPRETG